MSDTRPTYVVDLDCGETVYVDRLGLYYRQLMLEKAKESHPDPDPKQYEKPLKDAFVEGTMLPADANDDYLKAKAEARVRQNDLVNRMVIQCAVVDAEAGKAALLERYAGLLAQRRTFAQLPDEDWQALVIGVLVTTDSDRNSVLKAAVDQVTEDDVLRGLRAFQLPVWWA